MSEFKNLDPEMELVFKEVLELQKNNSFIDTIGTFKWETRKYQNGRSKSIYVKDIIESHESPNKNITLKWFFNIRGSLVDLIIDFNVVGQGEVTLHRYKRSQEGLKLIDSKILRIR